MPETVAIAEWVSKTFYTTNNINNIIKNCKTLQEALF